ncbi:MAG: bifunctional homocysteine S-methyltransferase/methylenetetrahydrofolate reductase [Anaerolineales bacterium]
MNPFLALLESTSAPILTDGAMGTMIHAHGIDFKECFDALNLKNPGLIAEIHRSYIDAGSQIILTNTFGANRYRLADHGLENQVDEINRAGVELARRVVLASFKEVLIAGDVGPLGVRLVPFGRVTREQARAAFREQIHALVQAGIDLIVIETMSDMYEIEEAVAAAREVDSTLPVVASVTFTRDDRTLFGDHPHKVARTLLTAGVDVIGVNCSGGPAQLLRILQRMQEVAPQARYWVKPNAGWPEQIGGRIMYPAGPDYFGEYVQAFRQAGAALMGGCCGTTPQHIAAMRTALDSPALPISLTRLPMISASAMPVEREQPARLAQKLHAGEFAIAVEMDPPRGLATGKLLAAASMLAEAGADVINVADSPMARMRMSPWAVCNLIQRKVGIETTLHFPTRGRNLLRVQGDLLAAHALGVRNVFVVMGDPTAIGDYPEAMDDYDLAPSGLIKLIKQGFNSGLDHAGSDIGQPTSFFVGGALNLTPPDQAREIKLLHRKVRNGMDFALTQPVYAPERALAFLQAYEALHGKLEIPILVGVLPLYSARHAAFLHNEVPGIEIPSEIRERIAESGDDAPAMGVRIAIDLVEQMRPWVQGVYIMPQFSRYDLCAEIVEALRRQ